MLFHGIYYHVSGHYGVDISWAIQHSSSRHMQTYVKKNKYWTYINVAGQSVDFLSICGNVGPVFYSFYLFKECPEEEGRLTLDALTYILFIF